MRVRLVPVTAAEYPDFEKRSIRGYARFQVAAGIWARRGALARARATVRKHLPDGVHTAGSHCWHVDDGRTGARVGHLWVSLADASGRREVFIYEIEIAASFRGRGYGAATLRALTAWSRRRRVASIRLRVHAHNDAARALYEKMGFAVTDLMMALPLG